MNTLNRNYFKLFVILVITSGCSKELPKASLVGTWNLTRFISGGCDDLSDNFDSKNFPNFCTTVTSCNAVVTASTFTFPPLFRDTTPYAYKASAGVLTLSSAGGSISYTYELTPGSLTIVSLSDDGCTNTFYFSKV
jgi:hypothetical protein